MSDTMVGLLGLATVAAVVVMLFRGKTLPAIAFALFPMLMGLVLVAGGRFGLAELAAAVRCGFSSTAPNAALFLFSVLYFGLMADAGLFHVLIGKLMGRTGGSVTGVAVVSCLVAMVGHLDGSGAAAFCILMPAMLPICRQLRMRETALLRIAVVAMSVMNIMPWAGPTMRAATVLGVEAGTLWRAFILIQVLSILLALLHAVLTGWQEKRRGAGLLPGQVLRPAGQTDDATELARPGKAPFNGLLTVAIIAALVWGGLPSYLVFMLGLGIALFVNYGADGALHRRLIDRHAGPALLMCSTLMGAAVLMGVLTTGFAVGADGTRTALSAQSGAQAQIPSVVRCMAALVTAILPQAVGAHLPAVIGLLSVPLALAFDTDSYFYGVLPIVIAVGAEFGVAAQPLAVAMVIGRNCATFISPMVPATLLGTGLAQVDIKTHIRHSFVPVWAFSALCLAAAMLLGIMG